VILSFQNQGTGDIFNRRSTKAARKLCPETVWRIARRKLDQLNACVSLSSLAMPPGNHLEALSKDRKGQHSIRVNDQYRVCFRWTDEGAERVELVDYH
jgi:toxin HigB-1